MTGSLEKLSSALPSSRPLRGIRAALLGAGALLVLGALSGCGSAPADDEEAGVSGAALRGSGDDRLAPEVDDAVSRLPWQPVGTGVNYKAFDGGTNVVILYGGYTAQDEWVQRWADEIYRVKGQALAVGHLYAVKGPNTAGYTNREIQNTKLVAHLVASNRAEGATSVVVIAHSSGTYVADEFLGDLKNGYDGIPASTIGKIELFNLDGGGVSDAALLDQFAHAYFVYGCDATIGRCSHNSEAMKSLGQEYASLGGALKVVADGSGCDRSAAGGLWCLHDTLINSRPHNPVMYDLMNDYSDFAAPRHLMTSYLDVLPPAPPAASAGADSTASNDRGTLASAKSGDPSSAQ